MVAVAEALQIALQHHQTGQLAKAEDGYRQILQVEPHHPDALHLLGRIAYQVSNHEPAIRLIEQAITLAPSQPTFHLSLAYVRQALGQLDLAADSCRKALRLLPNLAEAHLVLGNVLRLQGQAIEAESCYRQALRFRPNYPEAHNNLGNLLYHRGQLCQAEKCFREALQLQPDEPVVLANLGAVFRDQGRLDEAESCQRRALQVQPFFAQAQSNLGNVLLDRKNPRDAEFCFREALRLQPNLAEAHRGLGLALYRQGQAHEAKASYHEAIRLRPDFATAFVNLGDLMRDVQDIPAARVAYAEAIRIRPDNVEVLNNLAVCLIQEGIPGQAIVYLQQALQLRPGNAVSLNNLAGLARDGFYQFSDDEITQLQSGLANGNLPIEDRSLLSYSLANVLDKRNQPDEAFRYYVQANELKRQWFHQHGMAFNAAEHQSFIDSLIATFTPEFFRKVKSYGVPTELPVFVLGMPRSGTTLVEQILASHPEVFGAGERLDIPNLGHELGQVLSPSLKELVSGLQRVGANSVRAAAYRHLERLSQLGGPAARVTDKLPANIFLLGLIAMLFPRSRVIHCLRDKMDVCLSCYFQDFTTLSFATRLDDIAAYYNGYERLTAHWRATLPLRVLEVRYEDLVANQEGVSRQMIDFLDLAWDDRCLVFHNNKRVLQNSSTAQVRRPIYNSSVCRWRKYRRHLQPLMEALRGERPSSTSMTAPPQTTHRNVGIIGFLATEFDGNQHADLE